MTLRFKSSVDLNPETRETLVGMLNTHLATLLDMYTQIKQAHWNVRGPQFFARHELFDNVAGNVLGFVDTVAERVGALGGYATGTVRKAGEMSRVAEYDLEASTGRQHMRALRSQLGKTCAITREYAAQAAKLGDPMTEDLMVEIGRTLEQDLWFIESHLDE